MEKATDQGSNLHRRLRIYFTGLCLFFLLTGLILEHVCLLGGPALFCFLMSYFFGGYWSIQGAVKELLQGQINIDLLMVTSAIGAAIIREWPEGAVLLFLFSLSGTLEELILGKTRAAIYELMKLSPETATVEKDGVEILVPVKELQLGDRVVIRPGERIAADGIVEEGAGDVDQSAMTGESMPVTKRKGDWVFAGTLNLDGLLRIKVERVAGETLLAKIVDLVETAQSEKAESEGISRWFGRYYTVVVLGGSTLVFVVLHTLLDWETYEAFYRAITVLVVASPCAVVISVPSAILSSIAGAARLGILFKGGLHVEEVGRLRAIAFDKTGTLTKGKPVVRYVETMPGVAEQELLTLAASAEKLSEHPLAYAVVQHALNKGLTLERDVTLNAHVGSGLTAIVAGVKVLIGKLEFLEAQGVRVESQTRERVKQLRIEVGTTIAVSRSEQFLGFICCADELRDSAIPAMRELRQLGIEKLKMLTGDQANIASVIAGQLGIDNAADLLPIGKVEEIKSLKQEFGSVAMVGDGINDAPSLATASLGISLGGSGTAVALESADVVLMGDDLLKLPVAIRLGRKAQNVIRQNLCVALSVMATLLVLTLFHGVRLPLAVLGHEGSTVLVILNGLRLLRFRP